MITPEILLHMRPGEEWTLNGNTLDGLVWESDTPKPTADEIAEAAASYEAAQQLEQQQQAAARQAAIDHAKSLGFTDEMIAIMYPALVTEA